MKSSRNHALDFLRGSYIFLALGQHYSGALNSMGLAVDAAVAALWYYLAPSGEQIFLALAAFNIAQRPRDEFKSRYLERIKIYSIFFVLFLVEPFLRTPGFDLNNALYWGPLLTWMVVLALLATLYRFLGIKAILVLFLFQCGLWLLPMKEWNGALELFVQQLLHAPGARYVAPVDLFLGSGCIGLLAGYFYYHGPQFQFGRQAVLFFIGIAAYLPFVFFGQFFPIEPSDVWAHEYELARKPIGILSIWAIELMLFGAALYFNDRIRALRVPVLNWAGRFSLVIFFLHFILFIQLILPVRFHLERAFGLTLQNSFAENFIFISVTFLIIYLIRRSGVLLLLQQKDVK